MTFADAIGAGVSTLETMAGTSFTLDGVAGAFRGVLNSHAKGQRLGIGGYGEEVDAIMEANRAQFGTTPPTNGKRITADARRYVITQVVEDLTTYRLLLIGVNK